MRSIRLIMPPYILFIYINFTKERIDDIIVLHAEIIIYYGKIRVLMMRYAFSLYGRFSSLAIYAFDTAGRYLPDESSHGCRPYRPFNDIQNTIDDLPRIFDKCSKIPVAVLALAKSKGHNNKALTPPQNT